MQTILENIRIAGLCTAVPRHSEAVLDSRYETESIRKRFMALTGIENRRMCNQDQYASDLAYAAAERLLSELDWDRREVDTLIFVTQTPDLNVPATACVLQHRLGLSQECSAFDVNQGCAGYPYGLHIAGSQLRKNGPSRALLLVGDTSGKPNIPSRAALAAPIFGDAVTATALEWSAEAAPMYFRFGTDGSGWDVIMSQRAGGNPPLTKDNFHYEEIEDGKIKVAANFIMKGEDVFNFSTAVVPNEIEKLLAYSQKKKDEVNYFVFHQANKMINETIRKRLKLDSDSVPTSLAKFGNTSSASIPVTMQTCCSDDLTNKQLDLVLCGFGVGLSWASVYCQTDRVVVPDLVEI